MQYMDVRDIRGIYGQGLVYIPLIYWYIVFTNTNGHGYINTNGHQQYRGQMMNKIDNFVKVTHTDEANKKRRLTLIRSGRFSGENHPRWVNINIDEALRLYCFENKTILEISKELGISRTTLYRRLKNYIE